MLSTEEFKRCAQEYMDMVFRVAFSCLRSQADAEDVTQEVLLRLYETDYVFESRAHIKNWLVKVTYNEDGTVSIELHIVVENGVNIATVCRSIMSEVKYVVTKNTGVEVREVNVCVGSVTV